MLPPGIGNAVVVPLDFGICKLGATGIVIEGSVFWICAVVGHSGQPAAGLSRSRPRLIAAIVLFRAALAARHVNGPTVQDPFNSTYAWGYPYVSSILVPVPTAQPLLAGGLIGNSLGATVYAWYDRSLYLEAGLYNTYGPSLLSWTGNAYGPGGTASPAPYLRAAYEWN